MTLKDEKVLQRLDNLIEQEISTGDLCKEISPDFKTTLKLLTQIDKSITEYESK